MMLKKTGLLIAVLSLLVISMVGMTGCVGTTSSSDSAGQNGLVVSGQHTVYSVPDIAYISLGVETTGTTAAEAMDQNRANMNKVVVKIKELGVEEKDIQTSGLNLTAVYEQRSKDVTVQQPKIIGYTASNNVTVTVRDISKAPAILDGVVAAGANTVSGLRFGIEDDSKLRQDALSKSVKKAQETANIIAEAAGVKIVGIISIQESYSSAPRAADMKVMAAYGESTPVLGGEMGVTASVNITFKIEKK